MRALTGKNNLFLSFIGTVIVAFLVALLVFRDDMLNRADRYPVYTLNNGWEILKNGIDWPGDSLPGIEMNRVKRGEVWEIKTTLPREDIPGATLYFRTLQAVVDVEMNGTRIYTYGHDLYEEGRMLKRGFCMVALPAGYMGQEVTIRFTASEPLAFNGLAPVLFGTEQDLSMRLMEERRVPLFFGIFLTIYGLLHILVLPYQLFRNRSSLTPMFSAAVTLSMGLYIIGFYHIIELFSNYTIASTVVEYLSLYMLPTTISAYLYSIVEGKLKQFYLLFIFLNVVMFSCIIFLHAANLVHMTLYLPAFYFITFGESVPYIIYKIIDFRRVKPSRTELLDIVADRVVFFGFLVYIICSVLDTVTFSFAKYLGGGEAYAGIPFFTTGAVLFMMSMTAQFFLHGIAHVRSDATRDRLEQRAYTDPLTGLANRIRCEQEMQSLQIDDPFTIISLDLDGLKHVNDTLGHMEGDRLLSTFADALKKTFGDMSLVGRMGGDEFLIIVTGAQRALVKSKLRELERALFDLNLEEHAFRYSVSYGYASNHETHFGRHVRDIYMLADRRMYDMKKKRKQEEEAMT